MGFNSGFKGLSGNAHNFVAPLICSFPAPSVPGNLHFPLSFRFPHQYPACLSSSKGIKCTMHLSIHYSITRTIFDKDFPFSSSNIFLKSLIENILAIHFSPSARRQITLLYITVNTVVNW